MDESILVAVAGAHDIVDAGLRSLLRAATQNPTLISPGMDEAIVSR